MFFLTPRRMPLRFDNAGKVMSVHQVRDAASSDIIDAQTKRVIAGLKDEVGREVQGEKAVEIIFQNGKPIQTVDQFGIGRVRANANN